MEQPLGSARMCTAIGDAGAVSALATQRQPDKAEMRRTSANGNTYTTLGEGHQSSDRRASFRWISFVQHVKSQLLQANSPHGIQLSCVGKRSTRQRVPEPPRGVRTGDANAAWMISLLAALPVTRTRPHRFVSLLHSTFANCWGTWMIRNTSAYLQELATLS